MGMKISLRVFKKATKKKKKNLWNSCNINKLQLKLFPPKFGVKNYEFWRVFVCLEFYGLLWHNIQSFVQVEWEIYISNFHESEGCSNMTDSLRPHGLYSPWNSPGQNTGMGSLSFSSGSSWPRNGTRVSNSFPAKLQGKTQNFHELTQIIFSWINTSNIFSWLTQIIFFKFLEFPKCKYV